MVELLICSRIFVNGQVWVHMKRQKEQQRVKRVGDSKVSTSESKSIIK